VADVAAEPRGVVELSAAGAVRGSVTALADVDLRITAGERVAVIGPSGAGKSTLIGLLNGTVAATSGSVCVLGCRFGTSPAREIRRAQRRIGTVHQRFDLVDQLGVVHNVNAGRLGGWPLWKAVVSLVSPRGLAEAAAALERVGIGAKVRSRAGDLSGGEQQRVAIARVLVQRPGLVLADEPVASLDPARGREVIDLLLELSAELGTTLVTCLHDVGMALGSFERVLGLRHGVVVFDRPPHSLSKGDIRDLYALASPVLRP
jgi:phosphonate transport system ATP-binding protein